MYHLPEAGQDMCPPRVFSMNTESKEWRVLTGGSVGTETAYPINYISKQVRVSDLISRCPCFSFNGKAEN